MSSSPASSRSLSELPDCIVGDILSRVPARSICDCRCVCKTWLGQISDPFFSTLHANNSRYSPSPVMLLTVRNPWRLLFFDLNEIYRNRRRIRSNDHVLFHSGFLSNSLVLGSCKGLFLLREGTSFDLFIYNPNLNEYDIFDTCEHDFDGPDTKIEGMGMGYSASEDKYKAVKFIYTASTGVTVAKVCVLGKTAKTSWKNIIDEVPYEGKLSFMSPCGVSHGVEIYWFVVNSLREGFIWCFNVESEQLRTISVPFRLNQYKTYDVRIGVLKNRLYVTYGFPYNACQVQFLEDSGWCNRFIVRNYSESLHLLDEGPCGEILYTNDGDLFVYHNLNTTKLDQDVNGLIIESFVSVPSLISPKELLRKECAQQPMQGKKQYLSTITEKRECAAAPAAVSSLVFWLRKLLPVSTICNCKLLRRFVFERLITLLTGTS